MGLGPRARNAELVRSALGARTTAALEISDGRRPPVPAENLPRWNFTTPNSARIRTTWRTIGTGPPYHS